MPLVLNFPVVRHIKIKVHQKYFLFFVLHSSKRAKGNWKLDLPLTATDFYTANCAVFHLFFNNYCVLSKKHF